VFSRLFSMKKAGTLPALAYAGSFTSIRLHHLGRCQPRFFHSSRTQ
jgi:hypothetical protein